MTWNPNPGSADPFGQTPYYSGKSSGAAQPTIKWPGIVSITLAVFSGIIEVVAVIISTIAVMGAEGQIANDSPELIAGGCMIFVGVGLAVVAIIFGIVGVAIPNSNKVLGGIGIAVGGLVMLGICGLMAIGAVAGGP